VPCVYSSLFEQQLNSSLNLVCRLVLSRRSGRPTASSHPQPGPSCHRCCQAPRLPGGFPDQFGILGRGTASFRIWCRR